MDQQSQISKLSLSSIVNSHDLPTDMSGDGDGFDVNRAKDTVPPKASLETSAPAAPAAPAKPAKSAKIATATGVSGNGNGKGRGSTTRKEKPESKAKAKPKTQPRTKRIAAGDGVSADTSTAVINAADTTTTAPVRKTQAAKSKVSKEPKQPRRPRKSANAVPAGGDSGGGEAKKPLESASDAPRPVVKKRPSEQDQQQQQQSKKRSITDDANSSSLDGITTPLKVENQPPNTPPRSTTPTALSRLNARGFVEYEFQLDITPPLLAHPAGLTSDRARDTSSPIPDDFDYFSNTLFQPNQQQRMERARSSPSLSRSSCQPQSAQEDIQSNDSQSSDTQKRSTKRKQKSQARKAPSKPRTSGQTYDPVRSTTVDDSELGGSSIGNSPPPTSVSTQELSSGRASFLRSRESDSNVSKEAASIHTPNRPRLTASQSPAISSIIHPPSPVRSSSAPPNEDVVSSKTTGLHPPTNPQPPTVSLNTADAMDVDNGTTDTILTTAPPPLAPGSENNDHDSDSTVRKATQSQRQSRKNSPPQVNQKAKSSANVNGTNKKDNDKENGSTFAPPPPPLPGALGFNPASFFARNQPRKQQNTSETDTANKEHAASSNANDQQSTEPPNIVLHVPLAGRVNQIINFKRMAIEAYGFDALYPRLATARARRAQIDAASAALEKNERRRGAGNSNNTMVVNGDSASSDEIGELITEDNDDGADEEDGDANMVDVSHTTPAMAGKRRKKLEDYSRDDPFVDDSELVWQERAAATQDGFFVYSGPLLTEDQNSRAEKSEPKTRRTRRSRSRGDVGGAKKRSSNTGTATATAAGAGAGSRGRTTTKPNTESSNARTKSRAPNAEKKIPKKRTSNVSTAAKAAKSNTVDKGLALAETATPVAG